MDIIIDWDSSVASAPAAFKDAIENVVNLYDALFTNTETITIGVGYGEVGGTAIASTAASESESILVQGAVFTNFGYVDMNVAEYAALGGSISVPIDGYVGFSSAGIFNFANTNGAAPGQYDITAAAEHEISEVMGRISTLGETGLPSVLDELRYTAPGTLATATSTTAYFSLDGGTTDLGDYNTNAGADMGDWASAGTLTTDAFAAYGTPGTIETLSASDILLMNALGYTYNQNIANAEIIQNPILDNEVVGNSTNFAGLGGADLFLLKSNGQLGYSEIANTGVSEATVWFTWQSDGAASPEGNALQLDPSSLVTGTASNTLGQGGRDIMVATGYGTGLAGTYEFTAGGAVYVAGDVQFSGSGDILSGLAGANIEVTSGAEDDLILSSGTVEIGAAATGTNVIGANDTVYLSAGSYAGLLGGAGDVVMNDGAGSSLNLTTGTSATINGNGGYFGICGTGVYVSASGETVATVNDASFNLAGSYNAIYLGADTYLGLLGGTGNTIGGDVTGDAINLTTGASATIQGSGGYFGICGTNIAVTASGESVATISSASFSLTGGGNVVGLGSGSTLTILGGSGYNTVFSNDSTITAASDVSLNVSGGNDQIVLSSSGNTLGLLGGSGWTVSGTGGNTIQTLGGTSLTVTLGDQSDIICLGTGSQVDLASESGGISLISGSHDNLAILASATSQWVAGFNAANGDKIDLSQLLAGTAITTTNLADFVTVSISGTTTELAIHGTAGADTIMLAGVGSLGLSTLINDNTFVLPTQ